MFWGGIRFNGERNSFIFREQRPVHITCKTSLMLSFNYYIMKSETSSSLWKIMPDPIAPELFNNPWKTETLQDWYRRQCPLT
nr:unnamed protein product [Callosobruchus chinensis]